MSLPAASSTASSHISRPYTFVCKTRKEACLQGFRDLYESKQLFDVTLSVDAREFGCHRALLASSSDYFRAMFTNNFAETDSMTVTINEVKAVAMEQVLNYLYTGESKLESDSVQYILSAANLFQLDQLRHGCASFIVRNLHVDNCINIYLFAQAHECNYLEMRAWDFITGKFEVVTQKEEFLDLSFGKLMEIIRCDELECDEEEVFEAALRWLNHDVENRSAHIFNVLESIRFALMKDNYFYDKVKCHEIFSKDKRLQKLLDDVLMYMLLPTRWAETELNFTPRHGADISRVVVHTTGTGRYVLKLYCPCSCQASNGFVLCELPTNIMGPTLLITSGNVLYAVQGNGVLYRWRAAANQFKELCAAMDTYREQFTLVEVDKCIYAMGGCDKDDLNLASVSKYCSQEAKWVGVAPMPSSTSWHCATSYCGKLYVFGGEAEKRSRSRTCRKEMSRKAFCYDPRQDRWSRLADMKVGRALAGCAIFMDRIYVIGGCGTITDSWMLDDIPTNCLASVEIYNPWADTWTAGTDLPKPLCAVGVVKYNSTIYILGGKNEENISCDVYSLNLNGSWESEDKLADGTESSIDSASVINITKRVIERC